MLYNPDGTINTTTVDGNTWTGAQAPDGSLNIVVDSDGFGIQHPCGAYRVSSTNSPDESVQAPDGSFYVDKFFGVGTTTGPVGPSASFISSNFLGNDFTTYTFPDQNLGTPGVRCVVCVHYRAVGDIDISSVTIDGLLADLVGKARNLEGGNTTASAIYEVAGAGNTGNVVVTLSGQALRCAIQVYNVFNSTGLHDSQTSLDDNPSATVDAGTNFPIIACAATSANTTASGTNLSIDTQVVVENNFTSASGASVLSGSVNTGITFAAPGISTGVFSTWGA